MSDLALIESDTQHREWRITDHGIGEIAQATARAGMMISSDDERVGIGLTGGFQQRVFDGADGNPDRNVQANGLPQFGDAATRQFSLRRTNLLFQVKLYWQTTFSGLHRMDDSQLAVRLRRCRSGETKQSFRVDAEADRT
jgi:hypothetical protein